ncbi:histone-lysine N-methyltransferase SETMAR-like [Octopus bimaculoides]|uniref:histone-lysine N-methyltransferase SETMAR-like n=1 Tax=Octopus bimaculoides TaxID=37653 RepID=UPI00071D20FB|nr:histone-lysine N-methyltransferase SETMAR-like [Octopus bimaculoides]|eukprot:XP_014782511.1 PREDICTED: histone-lysine N-methyltransferase SETMAR-like [Octopus bimaculoides]
MLTLYWNSKGPVLENYPEKGCTINSVRYSALLVNKLKIAIRIKRQNLLSKKVLLLHDNSRPHTVAQTVESINQLGFEVLEHPAYNLDLTLFRLSYLWTVQNGLRGRRFPADEDVKEAVHKWLHDH